MPKSIRSNDVFSTKLIFLLLIQLHCNFANSFYSVCLFIVFLGWGCYGFFCLSGFFFFQKQQNKIKLLTTKCLAYLLLYGEHPPADRSVWRGVQPLQNQWVLQDKNSQSDTQGNCILKAGKQTRKKVGFLHLCILSFFEVHISLMQFFLFPFPELIFRQMSNIMEYSI